MDKEINHKKINEITLIFLSLSNIYLSYLKWNLPGWRFFSDILIIQICYWVMGIYIMKVFVAFTIEKVFGQNLENIFIWNITLIIYFYIFIHF